MFRHTGVFENKKALLQGHNYLYLDTHTSTNTNNKIKRSTTTTTSEQHLPMLKVCVHI